jgi:hypothetical protein
MLLRLRRTVATACVVLATSLTACGSDEDGQGGDETADDPPMETAQGIERCLRSSNFRTQLLPVEAGDRDAPDVGVAFQRGSEISGGGEIAVYQSEAEANSKFPAIETTAETSGATAERHGPITVVYFATPPSTVRDDVVACVAHTEAT